MARAFLAGHWQMLALTALIFALWQTPVVIPLKLLVVFLHELSHAAATVLTGGSVASLTVSPDQGGMVISLGGNRFLTLTAGYLGSLLIGVALFLIALRTHLDHVVLGLLGVTLLAVCLLCVREWFALAFGTGTAALMLAAAWFLGRTVSDLVLRVIGLASMIYVPYDIFSDTIQRSDLQSDARMLAEEFGGPTLFWGGLWLVVSLAVIWFCLRRGLGGSSNIAWRGGAAG
ncbi:MAG: M50 family metallopeptidase [Pseudooceanicola sp.]|nr:M50 family metallopeptidase [Pseudooceanicola sp.]